MTKVITVLLICLSFTLCVYAQEADDGLSSFEEENLHDILDHAASEELQAQPPPIVKTIPYTPPSSEGFLFLETFDKDVFSRWIKSSVPKFSGTWEVKTRAVEAVVGDKGLRVMEEAKHHGIAAALPEGALVDNLGKHLALSYEVKLEEGLKCGGAYLKLFHRSGLEDPSDLSQFSNETPYMIMFGPDTCGDTDKVHFIIKHKNPISGEWVEHHLVNPPRTERSPVTHQYGFHITPENTYTILVDGEIKKEGSMLTDFDPPFTPPTEIDDPTDVKPQDWVDKMKIPDPAAQKPDDWDDDAPRMIPDPSVTKPEDWLDDGPLQVVDPAAQKPSTWDDEEDGEWVPPMIPNPQCAEVSGCGPWKAPMIPNPNYKGKWSAPLIDNPAYKGPWVPRKVPNPHYFVNESPHAIADMNAIGFELWTMQRGLLFDNIVISRDIEHLKDFIRTTWQVRHDIEKSMDSAASASATPKTELKEDKLASEEKADENENEETVSAVPVLQKIPKKVLSLVTSYPLYVSAGVASLVMALSMMLLRFTSQEKAVGPPPVAQETPRPVEKKVSETESTAETREQTKEADSDATDASDAIKDQQKNAGARRRVAAKFFSSYTSVARLLELVAEAKEKSSSASETTDFSIHNVSHSNRMLKKKNMQDKVSTQSVDVRVERQNRSAGVALYTEDPEKTKNLVLPMAVQSKKHNDADAE